MNPTQQYQQQEFVNQTSPPPQIYQHQSHQQEVSIFFFFQISILDCAMYPSFFIHFLASQLQTLFSDLVVYRFFFYLSLLCQKSCLLFQ